MPAIPSGTITFLFTDIEGSTHLWEHYPEAMSVALARHDEIIRNAASDYEGYVFKVIGDAFCIAFATAPHALRAALNVQRLLRDEKWEIGGNETIKVRMALHTGTAEFRDNDYFGQPLNRTARLLAVGHGGQILLSAVTQELVRDQLPAQTRLLDLGEHRLRDLIRPERIYQVNAQDLPVQFPHLKTLDTLPNNLPLQLTSFVGREKELAQVREKLSGGRLVTLTGAGGAGKTRLALQLGADLLGEFEEGVWFVDLAPLADPALVVAATASALGLGLGQSQGFGIKNLMEYLNRQSVLIILDNCEHLVAECANLTENLLKACPGLTVLATSREVLGVGGEISYRVPSLSLPNPLDLPAVPQLSQYEAVQLFVDRAQAILPGFSVTAANAPAIAQICYRLDGIPLALELAAARIRMLNVDEIAKRLNDRFRLLTGGNRTALPRQQTLRALIDWSYDLLPDAEKTLLRRLAVFAGGWLLEDAEGVCSGDELDELDILELHQQLVNKSLVTTEEISFDGAGKDRRTRYKLLETIKQYAREKLAEAGELEILRQKHFNYYLKLANDANEAAKHATPGYVYWLNYCDIETDNLRAAFDFALHHDQLEEATTLLSGWHWCLLISANDELATKGQMLYQHEKYATLAGAFKVAIIKCFSFYFLMKRDEHLRLFEELKTLAATVTDAWAGITANILLGAYSIHYWSQLDEGITFYDHATLIANQNGFFYGWGWSVSAKCNSLILTGKTAEAQVLLPALHQAAEASKIPFESSLNCIISARLALAVNNLVEAEFYARKAIEFSENGQLRFKPTNNGYSILALIVMLKGQYDETEKLLIQDITQATLYPSEFRLASSKTYFGFLQILKGEYQAALETITALNEYHDRNYVSRAEIQNFPVFQLGSIATLALAIGEYGEGVVILSAVEDKVRSLEWIYEQFLAKAKLALSEDEYKTFYEQGKALDNWQAWEQAKNLLAKLTTLIAEKASSSTNPTSNSTGLSERELEVLGLVAQGLTDNQIADRLVISRRTVSKHLQTIYQKTGATSRTAATRFALDKNLVP